MNESISSYRHEKGKFFGCYLLCSTNPRYKGRTYIGFTVNPNRRIIQHNSGYAKGGAKRTSGKGPWDMVLICHGFPNMISALRFEWAWQNPEKSLRLKHIVPKARQFNFQAKFNVLSEMIRIGPWNRLGLTIRWLKQEYRQEFPFSKQPPTHMPIVYGLIEMYNKPSGKSKTKANDPSLTDESLVNKCFICKTEIRKETLIGSKLAQIVKCFKCEQISHTVCMAKCFIGDEKQLLPVDGHCPKCDQHLMWGDLIKHKIVIQRNGKDATVATQDDEETGDDDEDDDDEEDFEEKDQGEDDYENGEDFDY